MAIAAWPSNVPSSPLLAGFGLAPVPAVLAFKPAIGPSKRRQQSSIKQREVAFELLMTTTQYNAFVTFYDTTLKQGTLPFTWNDPITGTSYTWAFDVDNPWSLAGVTGDKHRIAIKLERR